MREVITGLSCAAVGIAAFHVWINTDTTPKPKATSIRGYKRKGNLLTLVAA